MLELVTCPQLVAYDISSQDADYSTRRKWSRLNSCMSHLDNRIEPDYRERESNTETSHKRAQWPVTKRVKESESPDFTTGDRGSG